jgi:preprotein translocase subunit SecF
MQGLNLIPHNTKIDFIRLRFITFGLSLLVILVTSAGMMWKGLNFGIDFKSGFSIVIRTPGEANLTELRQRLASMDLGDVALQEFGSPRDVLIRIQRQPGDDDAQSQALEHIKAHLGHDIEYRQVETVGPKAGQELIKNGIMAVVLSLIAMLVYIWFRFDWQFGVCAVVAILHDCFAILALYCFFPFEFNITAIVAILTTAGYSVNDTVVIYDRIRENLRRHKKMPLAELINRSINETLSRTVLTSSSTLLALFSLYFFGGKVIADFSLPILIGISIGTYSSIFMAAPLLLYVGLPASAAEPDPVANQN